MSEAIRRVLVVKLADIGDAIGTLPALRALCDLLPDARIDALVDPGARVVLEHELSVSEILTFAKAAYDAPRGIANPRAMHDLARFGSELRGRQYDAVIFFHHLTTAWGAVKYRALALATGAPIRAGLDNGRGNFLTHTVRDHGFGAKPEWAYWLSVVGLLGATARDARPTVAVSDDARATAHARIGTGAPYITLHPGIGAFGPARQWSPARMAAVGQTLAADGYRLVITGGRDPQARDAADELVRHLGATAALGLCRLALGSSCFVARLPARPASTPGTRLVGQMVAHHETALTTFKRVMSLLSRINCWTLRPHATIMDEFNDESGRLRA